MILCDRLALRLPRLGVLSFGLMALCALPAWSQYLPGGPAPADVRSAAIAPDGSVHVLTRDGGMSTISPAGVVTTDLPQAAREVLDQLTRAREEARREEHRKVEQARADTIQQLKQLQDRFAKAAQLDEAVAVRDAVRRLEAESADGRRTLMGGNTDRTEIRASADPGTLITYRDKVGQSFYFDVTGSTEGNVWGNVIYTDDSALAAVAVHAGLLAPGQRGVVKVTILPGRGSYAGTASNGVTSESYEEWPGSYSIEASNSLPSSDVLRLQGGGPGIPGGGAPGGDYPRGIRDPDSGAGDLQQLRDRVGQSIEADLVGSTQGQVWGTDVYTDDSSPAAAAVHAGILREGEPGHVRITILPGQDSYQGSDHNGVNSQPWKSWGGSFRIERTDRPPQEPRRSGLLEKESLGQRAPIARN